MEEKEFWYLASPAKRRAELFQYVPAVKEILAESSLLRYAAGAVISGSDDAHIYRDYRSPPTLRTSCSEVREAVFPEC